MAGTAIMGSVGPIYKPRNEIEMQMRQDEAKERMQHPYLFAHISRVENKLDRIISLLEREREANKKQI